MSRKKVTQVRLRLESLEDRMVLSSMGVLPMPTGTPPSALTSSSQPSGITTTISNGQLPGGQLPGLTTTGANGQLPVLRTGANGQLPGGQMPGLIMIGANGQLSEGQMPALMIEANGQLPGGQLPGGQMPGGQLPGLTTGAKGQERIIMIKSGTVEAKDQEHVVLKSGANCQLSDLTTTDRIFRAMKGTLGASDLAIGQKAS